MFKALRGNPICISNLIYMCPMCLTENVKWTCERICINRIDRVSNQTWATKLQTPDSDFLWLLAAFGTNSCGMTWLEDFLAWDNFRESQQPPLKWFQRKVLVPWTSFFNCGDMFLWTFDAFYQVLFLNVAVSSKQHLTPFKFWLSSHWRTKAIVENFVV